MFDNILIFIKLAELKSYTATAKLFQCTKSTISRKIDSLELYFNKTLIMRTSKSFSLTEEGKYVYSKFQTLPQQIEDTYNSLNKVNKKLTGNLHILLPAVISHELITPYITFFKKQHPNIILSIMFSPESPDMKIYDIALTSSTNGINTKIYNIEFVRNEHIQLYCTPQYAKKYGMPLEIDDIKSHNIISALDPISKKPIIQSTLRHRYTKEVEPINVAHSQINTLQPNHALKIGLEHNHIFWNYESLCKNLIQSGSLIQVFPEYYFEQLDFFIIHKKYISQEEQAFINFIKRCMNGTILLDIQNTKS